MKFIGYIIIAAVILAVCYWIGFEINEHWALPFANIEATSTQIHRLMIFNIILTLALKCVGYAVGGLIAVYKK